MGRSKKIGCDFFSHDSVMRNGKKVKALRAKFGLEGYAVWCMLLETMTGNAENIIADDELTMELLAADFGCSADFICSIITYLTDKLLQFNRNNGRIWCPDLDERLEPVHTKRRGFSHLPPQIRSVNGRFTSRNDRDNGIPAPEITVVAEQTTLHYREFKNSPVAMDVNATTHAPLWGRLVEKFHVTKIQTPEVVAEIEKNIRLIPPVRLYELFGKKDSPGKYHPDDITFRLNSDPLSLMTDNSAENIAARTFQPTNA